MGPSKRILDQLEQGRGTVRPLPTRAPGRHAVYACGLVVLVVALATGVVGWGTDSASRPASAPVRNPVFRPLAPPVARSERDAERLAAAIVNEPLQQHVLAQSRQPERMAGPETRAASSAAVATTRSAALAAVRPNLTAPGRAPGRAAEGTANVSAEAVGDSDIALLAALMAHANGMDAGTRAAGSAGAAKPAGTAEAAARLQRCARLSGAQAAQCKARACAGHWGQSSACRVTVAE